VTRHRSRPAAVVLAALLLLAGCGDDSTGTGSATTSAETTSPATAQGAAAAATFPATVIADQGEVTIPTRPTRIVSLSPSLTEVLYAIGAGDQVVAVDTYSDHPAGTPRTDLSGFRPNVEAIGTFRPDLVVLASDRDGIVDSLTAVGVPTLLLGSPAHLADVYEQVTTLGAATGHAEEAAELATSLRDELEQLAEAVPDRDVPLRYFYEVSDTFHSVTSDTFTGELLRLAGLESIADGAPDAAGGYPQLSAEYVLAADPDVVFLAHAGTPNPTAAEVAARPGWDQLRAVRDGQVVALDPDLSSRWGPRLVDFLRSVVDALPPP
jgi:iron complex transport system substrate-binding protein